MPLALRLRGDLDPPLLQRACNEMLRRHEALRTTFLCEKGQLLQVIAPRQAVTLPVVDVADFPPQEHEQVPTHLLSEEARQPFDLVHGPLFRVRLVRLAPREHLLLCPMHHIIADGWSTGVFVRELGVLYAAYAANRPSPLPELALQFAGLRPVAERRPGRRGLDAQLITGAAGWPVNCPCSTCRWTGPRLLVERNDRRRGHPRARAPPARRTHRRAQGVGRPGRGERLHGVPGRVRPSCSTATAAGRRISSSAPARRTVDDWKSKT